MRSIEHQLQNARHALASVAGTNAALEARLLAAHAWDMSHEALLRYGHDPRDEAALNALLARRMQAEPVAQILGQKDFWKHAFYVSRDVLTPRADSETMIETLRRLRPERMAPLWILDLGTGSGCLILSALHEYINASGLALDASNAALAIAAKNAATLNLASRCEFKHSDWCSAATGRFDVVLSNPPYIPTGEMAQLDADVRDYEPHAALDGGADGLDCYRSILQQLPQHLNANALVVFEVGMGQAADVAALGVAHGFELKEIVNDLAGIARVVVLTRQTLTEC